MFPRFAHCNLSLPRGKQFSNIIEDIRHRVFKNPNRYIGELSPPVYLLLKYSKYHKLIWDKAIPGGNLHLIIELDKLRYNFSIELEMIISAKEGHKHFPCGNRIFLSLKVLRIGIGDWEMRHTGDIKISLAVVEFFIEKRANDWDLGMGGAAERGHRDLVDFFIKKGARDWKLGMRRAKQGGHKDLAKFFFEKLTFE